MEHTTRNRLLLWLAAVLGLSLILLPGFWSGIWEIFSFTYLKEEGAYPWAVLALCFFWVYLKRGDIPLESKGAPLHYILGFAAVIASLGLRDAAAPPSSTLAFLLLSLGLFAFFFGRAARVPAILLGVYGFAVLFPPFFSAHLEEEYSRGTVAAVGLLLRAGGYDVTIQGQVISFLSAGGEALAVAVGAPSSGIASITIFIALFILMSLDFPLRGRWAAGLFLGGLLGTTLQNLLRLFLMVATGYHYGYDALVRTHDYAGYLLFPMWYAVFAFLYLRAYDRLGPHKVKSNEKKG